MTDQVDAELWAAMNMILSPGMGPVSYHRLYEAFGSALGVLEASSAQRQSVPGVMKKAAAEIGTPKSAQLADDEFRMLRDIDVKLIPHWSEGFPEGLKRIHDAPPLLYVKGEMRKEDAFAIGIVGSRQASFYGKKCAGILAGGLAMAGACVVSGLARGIDSAAHSSAIDAGGRTIAFIGSGLLDIYPKSGEGLAKAVAENGAVVSELPLSTPPEAKNFPRRNRLISGASLGVVIVEAGKSSGSLITAQWALEQGREVFAVPGPIDKESSIGTNRLIQSGAKLVVNARDILDELGDLGRATAGKLPDDDDVQNFALPAGLEGVDRQIMESLSSEPAHIDEISRTLGLPITTTMTALMMLDMKGFVTQLPGKLYVRGRLGK
ncbi:MAG: DNA-processing protein DprA [Planctomycetes bacterium]|nr:DNA-processing protein DprA [Planctomycetota bacterium]